LTGGPIVCMIAFMIGRGEASEGSGSSGAGAVFAKIVCVDETRLTPEGMEALRRLSRGEPRCYVDVPASEGEALARIGDADCLLVSWKTPITGRILRSSRDLRYVGMCCSLYDSASANVDIGTARELGIEVRGVRDYGDEGVVEFIFAELISLFQGLGGRQWGDEPVELTGRTLGIIGFGTTGRMVAEAACRFGMEVLYYSRTRKSALEGKGVSFAPLMELLSRADAVTTHLPRNTCLLDAGSFAAMKPGAVLVNTSLGPTFDVPAFCDWIRRSGRYAIFDADGASGYAEDLAKYPGVRVFGRSAGFTADARRRLTEKVLGNIRSYLDQTPRIP